MSRKGSKGYCKYWWDNPNLEIQLSKQLKQRRNKFKGGVITE